MGNQAAKERVRAYLKPEYDVVAGPTLFSLAIAEIAAQLSGAGSDGIKKCSWWVFFTLTLVLSRQRRGLALLRKSVSCYN